MSKNILTIRPLMSAILLSMGACAAYAVPVYTIKPITPSKVVVPAGGYASAQYRITNTGPGHILTMVSEPGIKIIKGGLNPCRFPFYLPTGESCILSLKIHSSAIQPTEHKAPRICATQADNETPSKFMCNDPSPGEFLEISKVPLPRGHLVAVGSNLSSLLFGAQFPISNNSSTAGGSWSNALRLPLPVMPGFNQGYLNSVACDSTGKKCVAVGSNEDAPASSYTPDLGIGITYTSNNGGASWNLQSLLPLLPAGAQALGLYSVTCNSTGMRCVTSGFYVDAGDNALNIIYYSMDGGISWNQANLPLLPSTITQNSLNSVSCDKAGLICTAVGTGNDAAGVATTYSVHSTDGGVNWSPYTILPGTDDAANTGPLISKVFCDAATGLKCVTTGSIVGPTPGQQIVFGTLYGISYTTTNGGATWSGPVTVPPLTHVPQTDIPTLAGFNGVLEVACDHTVKHCVLTGNARFSSSETPTGQAKIPFVYRSSNGGLTWSKPIILSYFSGSFSASLRSVACQSSGKICTVTGAALFGQDNHDISYTTLNGGLTWSTPTLMPQLVGAANGFSDSTSVFVGINGIASSSH